MDIGRINGPGLPAGLTLAQPHSGAPGFSVPVGSGVAVAPGASAGPAAAVRTAGLDAVLALQERLAAPGPGSRRDRDARRRGQALLAALAGLQHALLAEGDAETSLRQLAALVDGPPADEPRLEALVRSVSLRAAIELARRGW